MSTSVSTATGAAPEERIRLPKMLAGELAYALTDLWRSRSAFVFTFLLPLTWLIMIGFLGGNDVLDETTGLRVMQAATPSAAVMGVLFATMPTVAVTLALARENGVLRRVRGTPLPLWTYLLGRVGAAVVLALSAVVVTVGFGALVYDVQVQWRTIPALLITTAIAVASLASLGIAIAALARTAALAQAASMAAAVALAFLSGVFFVGGDLPRWADVVAVLFPLSWFHDAVQAQFDPSTDGAGWDVPAIAVMAAWAVASAAVAARVLRRERDRSPHVPPPALESTPPAPAPASAPAGDAGTGAAAVRRGNGPRPSRWRLLAGETAWGLHTAGRDPGWLFFAVAMPVGLYAFLASITPHQAIAPNGFQLTVTFAAGMSTWGAAVTGFMSMPEALAGARDRGLLQRVRGTPLSMGVLLAGRTLAAIVISLATGGLVVAAGVAFFDLHPSAIGLAGRRDGSAARRRVPHGVRGGPGQRAAQRPGRQRRRAGCAAARVHRVERVRGRRASGLAQLRRRRAAGQASRRLPQRCPAGVGTGRRSRSGGRARAVARRRRDLRLAPVVRPCLVMSKRGAPAADR
jgi:ABC-type multidrug transport system permease subunit